MQKFLKVPKAAMTQTNVAGTHYAYTTSLASNYINMDVVGSVIRGSTTTVELRGIMAPLAARDLITITISAADVDTINSLIDAAALASIAKASNASSALEYVRPGAQTIDTINLG